MVKWMELIWFFFIKANHCYLFFFFFKNKISNYNALFHDDYSNNCKILL